MAMNETLVSHFYLIWVNQPYGYSNFANSMYDFDNIGTQNFLESIIQHPNMKLYL